MKKEFVPNGTIRSPVLNGGMTIQAEISQAGGPTINTTADLATANAQTEGGANQRAVNESQNTTISTMTSELSQLSNSVDSVVQDVGEFETSMVKRIVSATDSTTTVINSGTEIGMMLEDQTTNSTIVAGLNNEMFIIGNTFDDTSDTVRFPLVGDSTINDATILTTAQAKLVQAISSQNGNLLSYNNGLFVGPDGNKLSLTEATDLNVGATNTTGVYTFSSLTNSNGMSSDGGILIVSNVNNYRTQLLLQNGNDDTLHFRKGNGQTLDSWTPWRSFLNTAMYSHEYIIYGHGNVTNVGDRSPLLMLKWESSSPGTSDSTIQAMIDLLYADNRTSYTSGVMATGSVVTSDGTAYTRTGLVVTAYAISSTSLEIQAKLMPALTDTATWTLDSSSSVSLWDIRVAHRQIS